MEQTTFLNSETQPEYVPNSDERTLAILSHVLTLVAGFIAPLVIYLIKKDESKFIADSAKESLNFQITLLLIIIGLFITIIGILLIWIVGIVALVFIILATVKTSEGKIYKYPFALRLIK